MKPFARINLSSVALRRLFLVSSLAHEDADFFDMRVAAPKDSKSEPDERLVRLCAQIVGRVSAPLGYGRPKCSRDGGTSTICLDALVQWGMDAPYIFGDLDDDDAKILLESFIGFRSLYHFDLAMQLARLLAERGTLVSTRMERIIAKTDWSSYGSNGLLLAYLGSVKGAAAQIRQLLDIVPEDGRDGLFVACWKSQSVRVHKKLLEKFEGWIDADSDFGSSTGEAAWLGAFIAKWMREETFPYGRLESLVRWHLARQTPKLLDEVHERIAK